MAIYTHDEALRIMELFEDVLAQHNVHVPSPEDDDRDEEDMIGMYGSTYGDLLDDVEENIVELLRRHETDKDVILNQFSETNKIGDDDMVNLIELLKKSFKHEDDDIDVFVSINERHRYTVYTENNKILGFNIRYFKNDENKIYDADAWVMKEIIRKYFNCYKSFDVRRFGNFQTALGVIIGNDVIHGAAIQRRLKDADMTDIIYMPVGVDKYVEFIYNHDLLTEINVTNAPMKDIYDCDQEYSLDPSECVGGIIGEIICRG